MNVPTPVATGNPLARLLSLILLLAPAVVLGIFAFRLQSMPLTLGAFAVCLGGMLFVRCERVWRPPLSASVILLYFIAFGWCWFSTRNSVEPAVALARGILLLVPLLLLISHDLFRTGAEPRRRAARYCRKLKRRRQWPTDLMMFQCLPEVVGLRENLKLDAQPVFPLLTHPSAELRMAAFVALKGRSMWRTSEMAFVLQQAQASQDSAVRMLAISALESSRQTAMLYEIGQFMTDPDVSVRAAATRVALGLNGKHWGQLRNTVRDYLANPEFADDRGLPGTAGMLPAVAVCDLTSWTAEADPLSKRAIQALVQHYAEVLGSTENYDLVTELSVQLLDTGTPTALRIELAHLLRKYKLLSTHVLDRMTNSDQPSSIRLLATEVLLKDNPTDPDALDVLRGLGRQPNREIAMAVARILQSELGFDMGLPTDRRSVNAKIATDVVKRVRQWAMARSVGNSVAPTPSLSQPGLNIETPAPVVSRSHSHLPPSRKPGPRKVW